jgi:hypothetical protein
MMIIKRFVELLMAACMAIALNACGGGSSGATIGGTVNGLTSGQSVVLQNNLRESITVSTNGSFVFPTKVGGGNAYYVTVVGQPTGVICLVANGNGAVDSSSTPVNTVVVTCTGVSLVGGTVSGLAAGGTLVLSNGAEQLSVITNGAFVFPSAKTIGTAYGVIVVTQPTGQTCTLANNGGVVSTTSPTAIVATCV